MRRPTRTPPRTFGPRHARPAQTKTWLVGLVTVLTLACALGFVGWTKATHVDLDVTTLCPISGPTAVHAVLLDQSDPITPLQAQRLGQIVDKIVDDAEIGERIDFYVLTRDPTQALAPRLSLCRPKSEGSAWTENPKRIHDRYIARFRQPVDEALKLLVAPTSTPSQTSPIMESVKAVCVAAFGFMPRGTPVRMTVASDMIQYSRVLDHYKQRDFETFAKSPGYKEVLADCHSAGVNILYLTRPRDTRVQDRKHQLFWEKFFDHENATLNRMETV
jgi:hypothetical protein